MKFLSVFAIPLSDFLLCVCSSRVSWLFDNKMVSRFFTFVERIHWVGRFLLFIFFNPYNINCYRKRKRLLISYSQVNQSSFCTSSTILLAQPAARKSGSPFQSQTARQHARAAFREFSHHLIGSNSNSQ